MAFILVYPEVDLDYRISPWSEEKRQLEVVITGFLEGSIVLVKAQGDVWTDEGHLQELAAQRSPGTTLLNLGPT